ncbi:MAG: substrate-binding domain-containing protein [Acidimicrobiales bacterium]
MELPKLFRGSHRYYTPGHASFDGNGWQALGVLEAARAQHVCIPAELSLAGLDDLPLSTWTLPPLNVDAWPWGW